MECIEYSGSGPVSLRRVMDINMEDFSFVIYACFVLPNYNWVQKETVNEQSINATLQHNRDWANFLTQNAVKVWYAFIVVSLLVATANCVWNNTAPPKMSS